MTGTGSDIGDGGGAAGGLALHGFALGLMSFAALVIIGGGLLALSAAAGRAGPGALLLAAFPPGFSREETMLAIHRAGALPVRSVLFGRGYVVATAESGAAAELRSEGAMLVVADLAIGPQLGGCAVISEPVRPPAQVLRP